MSVYNPYYEQMMQIIILIVLAIICISGLIGNGIVLFIGIVKRRYQNNVTNCFIMNLALNDFLFLFLSVPLTTYLGLRKIWIFGDFICKMHIYLAHVLLQATCATLAAMSIDRYLHIVHDGWYRKYRKPRLAQIVCLLIWTVSLVFMFPYTYFFNINVDKTNQSIVSDNCVVHDENTFISSCIFTFSFYYILPLTIIFLCYLRVFIYVRRRGYRVVKRLSGIPRQSIQLKQRRVRRILLGLTLAFALCWLPIHLLELFSCSPFFPIFTYEKYFYVLTTARIMAHALSYFNSCLNPFLYALLSRSFFSDSL